MKLWNNGELNSAMLKNKHKLLNVKYTRYNDLEGNEDINFKKRMIAQLYMDNLARNFGEKIELLKNENAIQEIINHYEKNHSIFLVYR